MPSLEAQVSAALKNALSDIEIDLSDEFSRNFERKAYFTKTWQRRGGDYHADKPLLVNTGKLRRSIKTRLSGNKIVFYSELPYAAIHNEGGDIKVTAKMKGYFYHKYVEAVGGFAKKKNGSLSGSKKQVELNGAASFYLAMSRLQIGRVIHIPQRQFIGVGQEVEKIVVNIVERNLEDFINQLDIRIK